MSSRDDYLRRLNAPNPLSGSGGSNAPVGRLAEMGWMPAATPKKSSDVGTSARGAVSGLRAGIHGLLHRKHDETSKQVGTQGHGSRMAGRVPVDQVHGLSGRSSISSTTSSRLQAPASPAQPFSELNARRRALSIFRGLVQEEGIELERAIQLVVADAVDDEYPAATVEAISVDLQVAAAFSFPVVSYGDTDFDAAIDESRRRAEEQRAAADAARPRSNFTEKSNCLEAMPKASVEEAALFVEGQTACVISQNDLKLDDPEQHIIGIKGNKPNTAHFYDFDNLIEWIDVNKGKAMDPIDRKELTLLNLKEHGFRLGDGFYTSMKVPIASQFRRLGYVPPPPKVVDNAAVSTGLDMDALATQLGDLFGRPAEHRAAPSVPSQLSPPSPE